MTSDLQRLIESNPPRDPAALAPLIKAATRLHRVVFHCGMGLALVLAALVLLGADRDKLLTFLPASLVPVVMLGLPFLYFWRRGRRRLTRVATEGQRLKARVTLSDVRHVGYGATTNRIVAELTAGDVAYQTSLAVGGAEARQAVGDEIDVLFCPADPRVVIAWSEQIGVALGQTMTTDAAATPRRARRIAIGVVIGSLLFFGLIALLALSQR